MAKSSRPSKNRKPLRSPKAKAQNVVRNSRTTVSGPAEPEASAYGDVVAEKVAATQAVASAFTFNPNKAAEYDSNAALAPPEGAVVKAADPLAGASTVTEMNGSEKVGSGGPTIGQNPTVGPLDRVRVDSTGRVLTTNQGVPDRRQSELAESRPSRTDPARRLHSSREDHALRPRAHSRAHRPRARLRRARLLRVHQRAHRRSPVHRCSRKSANRRRSSCASRRCSASAARPTRPAMSADSP